MGGGGGGARAWETKVIFCTLKQPHVEIADFVWKDTVPSSFSMIACLPGSNIKPLGTHAQYA